MTASPFRIDVPEATLTDLTERLARTRLPEPTPGQPWAAGMPPAYLRELVDYWRDRYDWRAQERALNAVPQYLVEIDGLPVHFVHVRAVPAPDGTPPLPILLTHGWPSTFTELLPLVGPLTDPGAHGGDPADAFDVVIPSLPGIAFSGTPADVPVTRPFIADLWVRLLTEVLGYDRFGVYGGDIGGDVCHWMGIRHPERVVGVHTIHPKTPTTWDPPPNEAEQAYLKVLEHEDTDDGGYSHLQVTRPDTLAAALTDSPAGLAAWIVEKFRNWGDCNGDVESRFSKDTLLTNVMLYWATGSVSSSFRTYYDYRHNPTRPVMGFPVGVTVSSEDGGYPRELADRSYTDVRFWHDPGRGGHFFPLEEPALLATDLRAFFRLLR